MKEPLLKCGILFRSPATVLENFKQGARWPCKIMDESGREIGNLTGRMADTSKAIKKAASRGTPRAPLRPDRDFIDDVGYTRRQPRDPLRFVAVVP